MTLDAYLKQPEAPSLTALSAAIGVSKSRLSQLRSDDKWPPELALAVERATGGALDASDLSPVVAEARTSSPNQAEAA
jgi:DNA-binding transcriptional regulator YdaS (Cro superfamily)